MKTSNKLIIGLISFISLYILVAFTEIRIKGWPHGERTRIDHITRLNDFSYLKIDEVNLRHNIKVDISEESSFNVRTFDGDDIPEVTYHIEGDTLVIDHLQNIGRSKLVINADKSSFRGITATRSELRVYGDIDTIEIVLRNSHLRWRALEKDFVIEHLSVTATEQSTMDINHINIKTLEVDLAQSYLGVKKVQTLKGSIKDQTHLVVEAASNKSLSKDSGSVVTVDVQKGAAQ